MRATKSGRDLPLYEIGVLLKIGGSDSYHACLLVHSNILSQNINQLMDSRVARVVECGDLSIFFFNWYDGSNPNRAQFFICFFLDSVALCGTDYIQ